MTVQPYPVLPPAPRPDPGGRHSGTEATRLLCAGVYLDSRFRREVIEELVGHEERPVAPSLGIDAVPVLAHALRCRGQEMWTGFQVAFLWVMFFVSDVLGAGDSPTPGLWPLAYAVVCATLWSSRILLGRTAVYVLDRTGPDKKPLRRAGLVTALPVLPGMLMSGYWSFAVLGLTQHTGDWLAVIFPLLLAVPVWRYRSHVNAVMCHDLRADGFAGRPRRELPFTPRYRRIGAAVDREQHAGLTIYDPSRPFLGTGVPYDPWSFAIELERRPDAPPGAAPLTGRAVLDRIRPMLEALRLPAAAAGRDRLRTLEIDEFVYLPTGPGRDEVSYEPQVVGWHLDGAVDEGGEARRHFLRVRVGGWGEQVVVSVLIRVHTQGGMLVLELAPHVLPPLNPLFAAVDTIGARGEDDIARDGVRALLTGPASGIAAMASAARSVADIFRTWLADPHRALPDGPATSVRELGSTPHVSLFQEMDISRYAKTVEERVISGTATALRAHGYRTDQFEKQAVNVTNSGVFIGRMSGGAVAAGQGSRAGSGQ